jgi:chromosome segregation ATPase
VSNERSTLERKADALEAERDALLQRVASLERKYDTVDHDAASQNSQRRLDELRNDQEIRIRELEDQLQIKWRDSEQTEGQLRTAKAKIASLENDIVDKDNRISELEDMVEEAEDQLTFANDQLTATEANLAAKQNLSSFEAALDHLETTKSMHNVDDVVADYEKRMKSLEAELDTKNRLVSRLEESVSELQFQLEAGRSQMSLHMSSIGQLMEDSDAHLEVSSLRAQMETLSKELDVMKSLMASKDEVVGRLNSELEGLRSQHQALAKVPQIVEEPSDGSDIESLRSHVISLAIALERSENKRAEAISRLLSERETNAKSLRRLSESVKRFYSSVGHGDA